MELESELEWALVGGRVVLVAEKQTDWVMVLVDLCHRIEGVKSSIVVISMLMAYALPIKRVYRPPRRRSSQPRYRR